MRTVININAGWKFTKESESFNVDLPHSYNAEDGQRQADYFRGKCSYEKDLPRLEGESWLEINGANSVAEVFINDRKIKEHRGGYSMFRVDLTPYLTGNDKLRIDVDNSDFDDVYPSTADFTFYGGIYRDVNIVTGLSKKHFALDSGRNGVYVTPELLKGGDGRLSVKTAIANAGEGDELKLTLRDREGKIAASLTAPAAAGEYSVDVKNVSLWNGIADPYLYTLTCELYSAGVKVDEVTVRTGFRTVTFDAEKGCFLNGKHIKLKGVSRHQDRLGKGNALSYSDHKEDVGLILEAGANSVRLAHYQQDEKFYDLCDESGLLVWAEVPVISRFSPAKQENAKSQLTELITQNYNHPSIFCWGVQNEITIGGKAKGVEPAIRELNALAHSLDHSRLTTSAQVMMCAPDSSLNKITDIQGYNLYYGWYVEKYTSLGSWLDNFHKINPEVKLCLSEYGAEAILRYQSETGEQGDYTEEYQAVLHDHYAREIGARDWMWGSYVWNMFDFGSANRNEAGVTGRNNKGLVTFDRKTRKDAFYVYKAHWSDEKFVRILGSRYARRPVGITTVTACSNLSEVTLTVNGVGYTAKCDKVVRFEGIEIKPGENKVVLTAGDLKDEAVFTGVDAPDPDYKMPEGAASFVKNWFRSEGGESSAYYSLNDRVGALMKSPEIQTAINSFLGKKKSVKALAFLVKPFKVSTLMKIARIDPQLADIVANYLQKKKKKK